MAIPLYQEQLHQDLRARWSRLQDIALAALRVAAALMFVQHGVQKHFGLLLPDGQAFAGGPDPFTMFWIAGTLEIAGGLLLAIGLFTRPVAFVLSGLMAFAYFIVHAPQNFWPTLNKGELAALYCFVFLAFAAVGGGRYSVDAMIAQRRNRRFPGSAPVVHMKPKPERKKAG